MVSAVIALGGVAAPAWSQTVGQSDDPFIAAKAPLFGVGNTPADSFDGRAAAAKPKTAARDTTTPITIRLAWDGRSADLDLHVVTPGGVEIAYYHTSDAATGGALRWDLIPSSACVPNRNATDEYIDFTAPTSGTYIVKVALYSTRSCASYPLTYTVSALYGGQTASYAGSYTASSSATGSTAVEVLRFTYDATATSTGVTFTPTTSCASGANTYTLPHLTTTSDSSGSAFTSVAALANLNASSSASVRACAYTTSGTLIGGSQFTLAAGRRIFALNPGTTDTATGQTAMAEFFQVGALPTQADFHAVIRSDTALVVQGGFVGNGGQFFLFADYAPVGNVLGQAHMGTLSSYAGLVYLSNPNSSATTASLAFLKANGIVANATQAFNIPGYGRLMLNLSTLTDPTGAALNLTNYYAMRVDVGYGGQVGGWNATVVPVGTVSTVSLSPLQVVTP